jgi:ferrous iron transport protein A
MLSKEVEVVKLTELKKHSVANIVSLKNIDKTFLSRLFDLGIYEGAKVKIVNILRLNRLYLIEIDDVELALRKEDAERIEVAL